MHTTFSVLSYLERSVVLFFFSPKDLYDPSGIF